jgi:hypothetical protein
MPIEKYNESMQIHLGFGDVEVAHGLLTTEETIGCVCFFNRKEAQPIGTKTDYPDNFEVEVESIPVRITFDKKESIDVIIRALQDAKTMMINKDLNRR